MKVVAFNGSPRKDGNTASLIMHVFKKLNEKNIECELIHIGGSMIRGCMGCSMCRVNKNMKCAIDSDIVNYCIGKMVEADGIILGSPTYFADITPELKALIDRSGFALRGNGSILRRKTGAAVVAVRRVGALNALNIINNFFLVNEMIVPGSIYPNIGVGNDIGEVERDEEGIRTMEKLGENMAWLLERTVDKP